MAYFYTLKGQYLSQDAARLPWEENLAFICLYVHHFFPGTTKERIV